MNTALMTKLQTLIYSNQDKLEALVEALESVCKESNTTVAPEANYPLEDYRISEKDVGSMVLIESGHDTYLELVTEIGVDYVDTRDWGSARNDSTIQPYTHPIKLHFKPHYANESSSAPSELVEGRWFAILFANGSVECSFSPNYFDWGSIKPVKGRVIIGYQRIEFVNPILEV